MERTNIADRKARRWKLAALLRARMEKVQARKEWMRFFCTAIAGE